MARSYRKPMMNVEKFVANEYVAACGDENKVYKFKCTAGGGAEGDVWTEDGRNLTPGYGRYYHACGEEHEAPTTDDFIYGYYCANGGNDQTRYWDGGIFNGNWVEYDKIPVVIWTAGGTNVHCTTNIDMNSWTTAKS